MDSQEVSWQVELSVINPGVIAQLQALSDEMIAYDKSTDSLNYDWFISADGRHLHVYERYTNSASALAHMREYSGRFGPRFKRLVERRKLSVHGTCGHCCHHTAPSEYLNHI